MSTRPMRLELYREICPAAHRLPDNTPCPYGNRHGWRWRIRATNGRILADSGEAYQRLRDCAHGAGLVVGLTSVQLVQPGHDRVAYTAEMVAWRITVDE